MAPPLVCARAWPKSLTHRLLLQNAGFATAGLCIFNYYMVAFIAVLSVINDNDRSRYIAHKRRKLSSGARLLTVRES